MIIEFENNLPVFVQYAPTTDDIKHKLIANAIDYKINRAPHQTVAEALKSVLWGLLEEGWQLRTLDDCCHSVAVKTAFDKYTRT